MMLKNKIEATAENFQKYLIVSQGINVLLNNIKSDTAGLSTSHSVYKHPDFQKLVELGEKIIPYIFHLITHHGGDWIYFHLLHTITKQNPVPIPELGRFPCVMMRWLEWYINSSLYSNDDIYHGLVD